MAFLLDTSAIIELERAGAEWRELIGRAGDEPLFLSAIGWAELLAGVQLADSAQRALARRKRLEGLEGRMEILPFTPEVAEVWAEVFAELHRNGTPIPSNDLAIAAIALHHNLVLLVGRKDEAHFRKIRRLTIEVL
jgi:predicted nucleic acid-binding protein